MPYGRNPHQLSSSPLTSIVTKNETTMKTIRYTLSLSRLTLSLRMQGYSARRRGNNRARRNDILWRHEAGQVRRIRRALGWRQRGVRRSVAHGKALRKGREPRLAGTPHRGPLARRHARQRNMARLYGHVQRNAQPRRNSLRTRHVHRPQAEPLPGRMD